MTMNRRDLLKGGLYIGSGITLMPYLGRARTVNANDPQYFLQIRYDAGLSCLNLFDARPLPFTAAGLTHNYLYAPGPANPDARVERLRFKDAIAYGAAGPGYYSPIVADLIKQHGRELAVVNGVHMSPNNDGHDVNTQVLMTGSERPSNLFVDLNRLANKAVYSGVLLNGGGNTLNIVRVLESQRYLSTSSSNASNMLDAFRNKAPKFSSLPKLSKYMDQVYANYAGIDPNGAFSQGAKTLGDSSHKGDALIDALRNTKQGKANTNQDNFTGEPQAVADLFAIGLTNHAVISIAMNTDSHGGDAQRNALPTYVTIAEQLNSIMTFLKTQTHYMTGKPLIEHVTLMIGSEFDRTSRNNDMAQRSGADIFTSGSDHNPLCNTIVLAGKGIRGGQVIGASDLDHLTAPSSAKPNDANFGKTEWSPTVFANISDVHRARDPGLNKPMGKVWDYAANGGNGDISKNLPKDYRASDYISIQSIQNTLLSMFGFRESDYLSVSEQGSPKAKILPRLIADKTA